MEIYSDSSYAVSCMNEWMDQWIKGDWRFVDGRPFADFDLVGRIHGLCKELLGIGDVEYFWIPREQNIGAIRCCDEWLDR